MPKRLLPTLGALLLAALPLAAADFAALQPQGYVSDFAGVVDSASREHLNLYCAAVEKATGAQLAFVVLPRLDGEPVEDVANSLFRRWGIGKKGENNGVLLLLSVEDKRSRLEVGYGLEPIMPDGYSGDLLRQMRPALRGGYYGEAFVVAAQQMGERIAKEKGVQISVAPRSRRTQQQPDKLPWPAIIFFIILALAFLGRGGGGGPWWMLWLLGNSMGRGGRSSGGGFGGYDSGGGFGGFGGGDSGGGGASSDW